MEGVVKHWNRELSREVVESPPLELFKIHVDVTFTDMVSWWIWQCWVVLDDLKGH